MVEIIVSKVVKPYVPPPAPKTTTKTYSHQLQHQLEQQGAIVQPAPPQPSPSVLPDWKSGPGYDAGVQPTPIPTTGPPAPSKPSYSTVYTDINKARISVIRSDLTPQQKMQALGSLAASERQVRQYEREGLGIEEVTMAGELPPGQMGPPAPVQGYQFTVPEEKRLEWAKYQVGRTSKLPPVIREVAQFGQGLVSSGLSLGAPVADVLGFRKEYDVGASIAMSQGVSPFDRTESVRGIVGGIEAGKYGIHYPSTLDVALEPVGWSPKGTTKFLGEHPAFTAGGVGGEVAQFVVGGEVIKAASKAAVAGARVVIPRALGTYGRIAPAVVKKVGPSITSKIGRFGETTIGKNIRLFSKGYVPATKGTEKLVGSASSKVVRGATTLTDISRTFKQVPTKWHGFAIREFVPKRISTKLLKPSAEITTIMRPATKEATVMAERTMYKTGLRGGIRRTYDVFKATARGGGTFVESGLKGTKGSLYNIQAQKYIKPLLESERALWHPKVNWLYQTVIPHQKGGGIPWIARQITRTGKEASATLLRAPKTITKLVSTGGKVVGGVTAETQTILPLSRLPTVLGAAGTYAVGRGGVGYYQPSYEVPSQVTVLEQKPESAEEPYRSEIPPQPVYTPIEEGDVSPGFDEGLTSIRYVRRGDERRTQPKEVEKQLPKETQDLYQRQLVKSRYDQIVFQERVQKQKQTEKLVTPSVIAGVVTGRPVQRGYGSYNVKPLFPFGAGGEGGGYAFGSGGGGRYPPRKLYTERTFKIPTLASTEETERKPRSKFKPFKVVVWRKPSKSNIKIPRIL